MATEVEYVGTVAEVTVLESVEIDVDGTAVDVYYTDVTAEVAEVTEVAHDPYQVVIGGGSSVSMWKDPVRLATTANITLSGAQTIDGVSAVTGDRVLVKNQTTPSQNGIYTVSSGSWPRAADANSGTLVKGGLAVRVNEGTANGDKEFRLTTNDPITLGVTGLTFVEFTAGGGGVTDGDKGDVTVSGGGTTWTLDQVVTVAKVTASTLVTEAEGLNSSDNDTSWPTTAAVKDYVDTEIAGIPGSSDSSQVPSLTLSPPLGQSIGVTYPGIVDGRAAFPIHSCTYTYGGKEWEVVLFPVADFVLGGQGRRWAFATRRNLTDGTGWETAQGPILFGDQGNLIGDWLEDSHNYVTIGVDKNGYYHIIGNMHYHDVEYARSTNAHDLSAWTWITPMVSADRESTGLPSGYPGGGTYPEFITLPNGELLMYCRWNGSYPNFSVQSSKAWIYKYNATTQTWSNMLSGDTALFDGNTDNPDLPAGDRKRGIYVLSIAVKSTGTLGIAYTWRFTDGQFYGHENLEYIEIENPFTSPVIKRYDGTTLTAPIIVCAGTLGTSEGSLIIDTLSHDGTNTAAAIQNGIGNHGYMEFDSNDVPHILARRNPNGSTTAADTVHCKGNGAGGWTITYMTGAFWRQEADRGLTRDQNGHVYAISQQQDRIYLTDMTTPGSPNYAVKHALIAQTGLTLPDCTPDRTALYKSNRMSLVVRPNISGSINWRNRMSQYATALHIPTDRIPRVMRGDVPIPRMRRIKSVALPPSGTGIVVQSAAIHSALQDLGFVSQVGPDVLDAFNQTLFVKLGAWGSVNTADTVLRLTLDNVIGFSYTPLAEVFFTSTVGAMKQSPWVPAYIVDSTVQQLQLRASVKSIEIQTITITGTGNFNLTFNGATSFKTYTVGSFDAADILAGLWAMSTIGLNDVTVTGSGNGPYTVKFVNGPWLGADAPAIGVSGATAGITNTETQKGGQTVSGATGTLATIGSRGVWVDLGLLDGERLIYP